MVLELRTENNGLKSVRTILGYDGIARDSDRVSVGHFLPVLDKARTVRCE